MAVRKSFFGPPPVYPELDRLLEQVPATELTEEELEEQRISFAYGNAPETSRITKESVREAAKSIRMTHRVG